MVGFKVLQPSKSTVEMYKKLKDEPYKVLKITCLTPKGKSKKVLRDFRDAIVGYRRTYFEKVVNDHEFYFIIPCKSEIDVKRTIYKASKSEVRIKQVYRLIFKSFDRANKWANKGKKGTEKAKKFFLKLLKKNGVDPNGMDITIEKDTFEITDREEMEILLKKELISVKEVSKDEITKKWW